MKKTALPFTNSEKRIQSANTKVSTSEPAIPIAELSRHIEDWLIDGTISEHSPRTLEVRRHAMDKFLWFLREHGYAACSLCEIRRFFAYLQTGHLEPGGRWGNPHQTKPLRPVTVQTFHKHLRTFFNWLVKQEIVLASPMEKIPAIVARPDQIQPFSEAQLLALFKAAKASKHKRRDEALLLFLLDTGLRASEVCNLKIKDVDFANRRCVVLGKGDKYRSAHFGRTTHKDLWQYVRESGREPDAPLFLSDRGTRAGEPLTRSGLFQLVQRLGQRAGIQATRCSPHTFRHTFAIQFLRNGGNTFTLKEILGHTSLHMTNRYVALAQADIANQHRQFSPADRLKRG